MHLGEDVSAVPCIRRTQPAQSFVALAVLVSLVLFYGLDVAWSIELQVHIQGHVTDAKTGHPIVGAVVSLAETDQATDTDVEGRFLLHGDRLSASELVVFHPAYRLQVVPLSIPAGGSQVLHVQLEPGDEPGDESGQSESPAESRETVVVGRLPFRTAERAGLPTSPTEGAGRWELTRRDLQLAPGGMGDVAKVVGQLPGVVADTDMFAVLNVRGAAADETVFLLDGVELLHPNHLGGTFTVFNPELVDTVTLHASAPPAPFPDSMGGALAVEYIDGDSAQLDGIVDVNMAMASAQLSGPLGPRGAPFSFLISARRSYFEAYFALMKAFGVLGDQFGALSFGDYTLRVAGASRDGRHKVRCSVLYAHDGLRIEGSQGAEQDSLLVIERGIATSNRLALASAEWRWFAAPWLELHQQAYFSYDFEDGLQEADFEVSREIETYRPGWKGAASFRVAKGHFVRAGLDLAYFSLTGDGTIKDPRTAPPWAALPWGDFGAPSLEFEADRVWTELSLYVEGDMYKPAGLPLHLRGGLRVSPLTSTREVLVSPRLGLALPLPSQTTVKAGWAWMHNPLRDPVVLDPAVGGLGLRSQRAMHLTVAVEQLLPFGGLVRVDAYHVILDRLLVYPRLNPAENSEAAPAFASVGTGRSSGADVLFALQRGRVRVSTTWSFLSATRTNPLHEEGQRTYPAAWDQRVGFRAMGEVRIGRNRRWRLAGFWDVRSGRPRTEVRPTWLGDRGSHILVPGPMNQQRYSPFTELSVRGEYGWVVAGRVKLSVYIDVLNATFARSDFIWIYGAASDGDDEEPDPPEPTVLHQLPIRPWIGMRAEF
ncbi:MAG: hypothetical protein CL928_09850 [Deltaproteobacteria bacterium]|nr:hypothetical protein [Deltaproteobacteria bacterium]